MIKCSWILYNAYKRLVLSWPIVVTFVLESGSNLLFRIRQNSNYFSGKKRFLIVCIEKNSNYLSKIVAKASKGQLIISTGLEERFVSIIYLINCKPRGNFGFIF